MHNLTWISAVCILIRNSEAVLTPHEPYITLKIYYPLFTNISQAHYSNILQFLKFNDEEVGDVLNKTTTQLNYNCQV